MAPDAPRVALIGARSCDLPAIAVQDRTFLAGPLREPDYAARRRDVFVVGVNCGQAGGTCFCVSMKTGPAPPGFDWPSPSSTTRTASSSRRGASGGSRCSIGWARPRGRWRSRRRRRDLRGDRAIDGPHHGHHGHQGAALPKPGASALGRRGRALPRLHQLHAGLPHLLLRTVEDVSDLAGETAERWRRWDSCFTLDHSYLHGGSVRGVHRGPLPPVAHPQGGELDRPVRHLGLRRLRALHHLVSGRHRHHRGGGGHPRRRWRRGRRHEALAGDDIAELRAAPLPRGLTEPSSSACFAAPACSRSGRRLRLPRRRRRGRLLPDPRRPGRARAARPRAGHRPAREPRAGDILGLSWLFRGPLDAGRARASSRPRFALDATCVRAQMEADRQLGLAIAKQLNTALPAARARPPAAARRLSGRAMNPAAAVADLVPEPVRVLAVDSEIADVVTLRLEGRRRAARSPPGQFNMLYAFGVGEVAISMSGDPAAPDDRPHRSGPSAPSPSALRARARPGGRACAAPSAQPWPSRTPRGAIPAGRGWPRAGAAAAGRLPRASPPRPRTGGCPAGGRAHRRRTPLSARAARWQGIRRPG